MTTQVQPKSRTLTANGINIHYLDWGAEGKPPLVLLHGLRGHAAVWTDVAEALCADYHVYAMDQRGRGDTDHAPGGDYSTDAFVADLAGFVDALGLDRFILFGHSMGGRNSMAFAGQYPERLERLCIVDIGPRIEPAGGSRITEELRSLPPQFDNFEDALAHVQTGNRFASEPVMRRRLTGQTRTLPDGSLGWKFDPAIREQRINGTAAPAAGPVAGPGTHHLPHARGTGHGDRSAPRSGGAADDRHPGAGNPGPGRARRAYGLRGQPCRLYRRGAGLADRLSHRVIRPYSAHPPIAHIPLILSLSKDGLSLSQTGEPVADG